MALQSGTACLVKIITHYIKNSEFVVGRSKSASLDIPAPEISRRHSVIHHKDDRWMLCDYSSTGTTVNGTSTMKNYDYPIADGDLITFGGIHEYRFYTSEGNIPVYQSPSKKRKLARDIPLMLNAKLETATVDVDENTPPVISLSSDPSNCGDVTFRANSRLKACRQDQCVGTDNTCLRPQRRHCSTNTEDLITRLEECIFQLEERLRHVEEQLEESEYEQTQLAAERLDAINQLLIVKSDLGNAEVSLSRLRQEAEFTVKSVGMLREELLASERKYNTAMREKEELQTQLTSALERQASGERRIEMMSSELQKRNNAQANFTEIVERELQCSICNEIVYQVVTLACQHMYCLHCITTWMKKKKECPMCREPISKEINRSRQLDIFIDAIVDSLSHEVVTRRRELVQQRQEVKSKKKSRKKKLADTIVIEDDPVLEAIVDLT